MNDTTDENPGARVIAMPVRVADRLSVALTAQSCDALAESVEREGLSRVDIVNRAVQVYNEIQKALADGRAPGQDRGRRDPEVDDHVTGPPRSPDVMGSIRRHYGVPAKRGMRITFMGRPAVIVGATLDGGMGLRIRIDGEQRVVPVHPTWEITYPEEC